MENPMKARVLARLAEMNLKPSSQAIRDALEAEGLNKTYLYELVSGRKSGIPQAKVPVIARVLGVTPDYLNGLTPSSAQAGVRIIGICEAGAWREPNQPRIEGPLIIPDHRVRADRQVAYLVRGNHAENLGIGDAAIVVAGTGVPPRKGEIVVAERARADGMRETFIRRFDDAEDPREQPIPDQVIGVVLFSIKTF